MGQERGREVKGYSSELQQSVRRQGVAVRAGEAQSACSKCTHLLPPLAQQVLAACLGELISALHSQGTVREVKQKRRHSKQPPTSTSNAPAKPSSADQGTKTACHVPAFHHVSTVHHSAYMSTPDLTESDT
jgi:hypothetical protein